MKISDLGSSDGWVPETAKQWFDWLTDEERKTVASYRNRPKNLIADYNRERAIARDYEGREILELLQNANDQAAEVEQHGRVLIELSPDGLIVSNTGRAFSVGGVASLQTSHLSPKRRRRKQIIGNKGLGFRSILNWTKTPIILSNSLCIAYCLEHARKKLNELVEADLELARLVEEERQGGDALILPLLLFPLFCQNGNLAESIKDGRSRKIFEQCELLLLEGYNSVIGMPFESDREYDAAEKQIQELRPEILLFAQNLGEICFRLHGKEPVIWKIKHGQDLVKVLENDKPLGTWQLHRTTSDLPPEYVAADQAETTQYEIVVAVPLEQSNAPGRLFSYFPTDVALPLSLICHATLELEQNRKHLQEGRESNRYILGQLAKYIAKIVEDVAQANPTDAWAGCELVIPTGDYANELKREGFPEKLALALKSRQIVPILVGKPVTPERARLMRGNNFNWSWLPPEVFSNVVPLRNEAEMKFLRLLEVPTLEALEVKRRITANNTFTFEERIALITGLVERENLRDAFTSALLVDSAGNVLMDDTRAFLAPSTLRELRLPTWADLQFLNADMRLELGRRLKTREARELQQKLSGFGLQEYSLANVVRALVAETHRAERANPARREEFQADLLQTLFNLYLAEEPVGKRPEYPERSPIHLHTQNGEMAPANALYLGRGFGKHGEITQALFDNWGSNRVVSHESVSKLTSDEKILSDFLLWIGVAQWPRIVKDQKVDPQYLIHVLRSLHYPVAFEDKVVVSVDRVSSASLFDVETIDELDKILAHADPSAITGWLANDDRALTWGRPSSSHAKLQAFPDGVHRARRYLGELPSYIRWRIESTPWLKSSSGRTLMPKDCVLGERAVEQLFPRPAMPTSDVLNCYGIQQRELLEGWRRAGILTSLAYLDSDQIYSKLLELPQRSHDGKFARPLYHWLLDSCELTPLDARPNRSAFLSSGKMWGRHGNVEGYFSVKELRHADVEGLPDALLRRLKVVDLRHRAGVDRVEKLFGVKPVLHSEIQQKILLKELAVGSTKVNQDFQDAKPYLHMLRSSQTSQLTRIQTLKELQIEVCSLLRAELKFENEDFEYDVPVWGFLIEGNTLYIRVDPAKPISLAESLLADSIAEALASIFRISEGGDFARILLCKAEDRLMLLRRLRGDSALHDLDSIKAAYASSASNAITQAEFPIAPPPAVVPTTPESNPQPNPGTNDISLPAENIRTTSDATLQVIENQHIPSPPAVPRKLQIKSVTSVSNPTTTKIRLTDGDFCERKAMEFEEATVPPRWPLIVGQIMGSVGPGCDILSFASLEDREAFRLGPERDLNKVVRFIEVKGRGGSSASIELRGNELSAAERYGDRYFLYRMFEVNTGLLELCVLQNPLEQKEALRPAVHVDIDRAKSTNRYSLIGGLTKNEPLLGSNDGPRNTEP